MPSKVISTAAPTFGLRVSIDITLPGEEPSPAGEVQVCTTRQRFVRNPRRSLYKHKLTFLIHRDGDTPLEENCVFTTRSHPLTDPFDHLERLLRATHFLRGHSSLVKPAKRS